MKRKSNLVYPTRHASPDPRVDVVLAYAPEPTGGPCAGHPGIASVWAQNQSGPGWHCAVCHPMPEAETKGETE